MAKDLSDFLDFMEEADPDGDAAGGGFHTPPMPSREHPDGRRYVVPSPDALTGVRLATMADLTVRVSKGAEVSEADVRRLRLNDDEEREFLELVLGSAFQQMLDDGVLWVHLQRVGQYAFLRFGVNQETADRAAEAGLFAGKALTPPNRAARRASTRTTSASAGSRKTRTRKN